MLKINKKIRNETKRLVLYFLFLFIFLCFSTGCLEKQRASYQIGSVEKILFQAKDLEASAYAGELLRQTEEALNRAKTQYQAGDYKGAYETIKTVKKTAQMLLTTTKTNKAEADFRKAEAKYNAAVVNQGKGINPQLFDQIQKNMEYARKAYAGKKTDKIIKYSGLVIEDVNRLLAELATKAKTAVEEAKVTLQKAVEQGVENIAPDAYQSAKTKVDEVSDLLTKEKYLEVLDKVVGAKEAANLALESVLRKLADEALGRADKLLVACEESEASKYVALEYKDIKEKYGQAWNAFANKNYETALTMARLVEESAPKVLAKAQKLKFKNLLSLVEKKVDLLKINDAEKYAPEFLAEVENMLKEAKAAYEKEDYEETKKYIDSTEEKIESANDRIRIRIKDELRNVEIAIKDAQDAQAVTYAADILATALTLKAEAEGLLEADKFHEAAQTAYAAIEKAKEAKTVAIKRNAELNLLAAEREISRGVGEGINLYAPKELAEARELLKKGQDAYNAGEYLRAIDISQQVNAKVAEAITVVREKATAEIKLAQDILSNMNEPKYMVGNYPDARALAERATKLLAEAHEKLSAHQYNKALETAKESIKVATEAKNMAIQMQIADRMPSVKNQIDEAKLAGAYSYAIKEYDLALANLAAIQKNLDAKKYDAALESLNNAELYAQAALRGQINRAQQQIESAKSVGGWQHAPRNLQRAVTALGNAIKAMERRAYDESLRLATTALSEAAKAEAIAKENIISKEISEIKAMLDQFQMGQFFLTEKTQRLKNQVLSIEKNIRESSFVNPNPGIVSENSESSRNNPNNPHPNPKNNSSANNPKNDSNSDNSFKKTMELLKQIKEEISKLPAEAQKRKEEMVKEIEQKLDESEAIGAKAYAEKEIKDAKEYLRLSDINWRAGNYAEARKYLDWANGLIALIDLRRQENEYKIALEKQLDRFNKCMADFDSVIRLSPYYLQHIKGSDILSTYESIPPTFQNVVSLSPDFLKASKGDMRSDPYAGLQTGGLTAGKFRQITKEIYANVKQLTPPYTLSELHRLALSAFEDAKLAGEYFDKFGYHAQFNAATRDKFIDAAFAYVESAWRKKQKIDFILYGGPAVKAKPDPIMRWLSE